MDPTLVIIAATFLLAGLVKGVIGLGLPTVSLAILTVVIDLPSAMALLLIPSFVTNVWQAFVGGQARAILRRIWPFLLLATLTIWLGARALRHIELAWLSALLGLLLIAYALSSLRGLRLSITPTREKPLGALLGIVNGVLTGMTGSFVVPGVIYLQAIGLERDALVQAMGMLFALSTLALGIALQGNGLLTLVQLQYSALALLPALGGMIAGRGLRQRIAEAPFRRLFFFALLALGAYIALASLTGFAGQAAGSGRSALHAAAIFATARI